MYKRQGRRRFPVTKVIRATVGAGLGDPGRWWTPRARSGNTGRWRPSAPPKVWTIPNTCCGWPSWNSSTATSAWWGGGSALPGSLPSKAWTPSTFTAIPSVNKSLVMELARCEYIQRRENIIAVGNSGTGKTHMALGLGLAAYQRGMSVGFTTAAALVHELMEARDERRLLNLQRQLSRLSLLIIDELGFVPLSPTGAELLFEVFS